MRFTTVGYNVVEYGELDRAIAEEYGREFSIVADQELGNDSTCVFSIKKEPIGDYSRKKLDEFVGGANPICIGRVLMQDMVNRDIILGGKWIIEVCW